MLELRDEVVQAIDAGDVPGALEKELLAAVERLVASIPEEEEPPPEEAPDEKQKEEEEKKQEDEDKGKGKDKDKGKGDGKKDEHANEDENLPDLDDVTTTVG